MLSVFVCLCVSVTVYTVMHVHHPHTPHPPPHITHSYVVSGAGDGFVKVWSPQAKACLRTLQGHHGSVLTLIAGDGVVISGSRDSTVKVGACVCACVLCMWVGG